jgi:hypothetical protein
MGHEKEVERRRLTLGPFLLIKQNFTLTSQGWYLLKTPSVRNTAR